MSPVLLVAPATAMARGHGFLAGDKALGVTFLTGDEALGVAFLARDEALQGSVLKALQPCALLTVTHGVAFLAGDEALQGSMATHVVSLLVGDRALQGSVLIAKRCLSGLAEVLRLRAETNRFCENLLLELKQMRIPSGAEWGLEVINQREATVYSNRSLSKMQMGDGKGALLDAYMCRMMSSYSKSNMAENDYDSKQNHNTTSGAFYERNPHDSLHGAENTVTWSLNGNPYEVLRSYVHAIVHYRFWNFYQGKCIDLSPVIGYEKKIYTTPPSGSFCFRVTYENEFIDFEFDGRASWFTSWSTKDGGFQFKPECKKDLYADPKSRKVLQFTGTYGNLAPGGLPGNIKLGLSSVLKAFKEVRWSKGETTTALQHSLAVWIMLFGEASKFHKIFYYCCLSILSIEVFTLNTFDESLGKMCKLWGKLCAEATRVFLESVACGKKLAMRAKMRRIEALSLPGIRSVKDVIDNVCLWTFNCTNEKSFRQPESKFKYQQSVIQEVNEESLKKLHDRGLPVGTIHRAAIEFAKKNRPRLF